MKEKRIHKWVELGRGGVESVDLGWMDGCVSRKIWAPLTSKYKGNRKRLT